MSVEDRVNALAQQIGLDVRDSRDRLASIESKSNHITVSQPVNLNTMESRINELDSAVVLKGSWNPGLGTFPGLGVADSGHSYIVTASGTVDGVSFNMNDRIVALTDSADENVYLGNWLKLDYSDQVSSVNGRTGTVSGLVELTQIGNPEANFLSVYTTARDGGL